MFRWIDLVAQDYCVRSKYVPVQLVLFTRLLRTQQICSGAAGFIHKITAYAADMFRCSRFYSQDYCERSRYVPVQSVLFTSLLRTQCKCSCKNFTCTNSLRTQCKCSGKSFTCTISLRTQCKCSGKNFTCTNSLRTQSKCSTKFFTCTNSLRAQSKCSTKFFTCTNSLRTQCKCSAKITTGT